MQNSKQNRGTASVEFALVVPVLMLMMAGAADFARVFYHSITVYNASQAAAVYGARNCVLSADYAAMESVALQDAADLEGVSSSPERFCDCPDGTTKECFLNQTCNGFFGGTGLYGMPRGYVELTVEQTFEPLLPWPGIPNPLTISETTYMRVR